MGKKVEQENLPSVVMPSCEMRKILTGQKALATGANSGIGKTVAIALGQAGADVVVNYVTNPDQAEDEQAEELLRINRFDNEPELQTLIDKIAGGASSTAA